MHSLEWHPDFEKKQLRKVEDLPWSIDFPADSHRIPKNWVENRHKWRDENGRPQMPLWLEESQHSDCLAQMQEISYHKNIGAVQKCAGLMYEQQDVVLECEEPAESLKEILQGEVLEMQKELAQRKSKADPKVLLTSIQNLLKKETASSKKSKVLQNLKKCADKVLKTKMVEGLRERLKLMNRQQALQRLVPEAGKNKTQKKDKQIKKKPYSQNKEKYKQSKVNKNKLKNKTPKKKHEEEKNKIKTMMNKELLKKNKEPEVASSAEELAWVGRDVQITSEAAGHLYYAKHGTAKSVKMTTELVAMLQLGVTLQTCSLPVQYLTAAADIKKPRTFKSLVNMSKSMKKEMLQLCNLLKVKDEEDEDLALPGDEEKVEWQDALEVAVEKQEELLAHHIELAWRFMVWALEAPAAAGDMCLEASLAGHWKHLQNQSQEKNAANAEAACERLVKICKYIQMRASSADTAVQKILLVPVHGMQPQHWTLLVVQMDQDEEKVKACRYYDTLQQEHQDCRTTAEGMLEMIQHGFQQTEMLQLPARANSCTQTGSDCGLYTICYMEKELRMMLQEGAGAVPWPSDNIKFWRSKLQTVTNSLQKELHWISQQEKDHAAKQALKDAAALKTQKGKQALEKQKQYLKELQKKSLELMAEGGTDLQRLPEKHQVEILRIEKMNIGVCSTCRWTSGCHHCDLEKAKRFYLKKFAVNAAKEALQITAA